MDNKVNKIEKMGHKTSKTNYKTTMGNYYTITVDTVKRMRKQMTSSHEHMQYFFGFFVLAFLPLFYREYKQTSPDETSTLGGILLLCVVFAVALVLNLLYSPDRKIWRIVFQVYTGSFDIICIFESSE